MDTIFSYGPSLVILLLGSFLLLAAIVGGGLEIKELKIPKIEKAPRILTAMLGLMLMVCGASVGLLSFMSPLLLTRSLKQQALQRPSPKTTAPTRSMSWLRRFNCHKKLEYLKRRNRLPQR